MDPRRIFLLGAAMLCCAIPSAAPLAARAAPKPAAAAKPTTEDLVRARQAGMHMAATLFAKGIGPRAKGEGDIKDTPWSQGLELWAAAIPGLFPKGSAHPQSRAKPEIWADKADFDAKAKAMGEAAARVTAAGKAGDQKAYSAAAAELTNACKACHVKYRAEERPAG